MNTVRKKTEILEAMKELRNRSFKIALYAKMLSRDHNLPHIAREIDTFVRDIRHVYDLACDSGKTVQVPLEARMIAMSEEG